MPCTLYRHYDKAGNLLYVGISARPISRHTSHRSMSPWWRRISRIELEHFDSRYEALEAEEKAIRQEKPVHNKTHVTTYGVLSPYILPLFRWAAMQELKLKQLTPPPSPYKSIIKEQIIERLIKQEGQPYERFPSTIRLQKGKTEDLDL